MFRDNNIGVLILNQNGPGLKYSNLTRNAAAFFCGCRMTAQFPDP